MGRGQRGWPPQHQHPRGVCAQVMLSANAVFVSPSSILQPHADQMKHLRLRPETVHEAHQRQSP